MVLRQPIPQIRRQQQRLITIKRNEVLGHTGIVLNPPDTTNYATATARCGNDAKSADCCFSGRRAAI